MESLGEVGLFGNGLVRGNLGGRLFGRGFLNRGLLCGSFGGNFLCGLFGRRFLSGSLFDGLRLFFAAGALGQGSENLLRPCDNLIAVGSNNVDGTGNGSQSGQDFYDYIECFHGNDLQNFLDSGADLRHCDFYTPSITNVVKKSNT